ncbi:flagellar protein FlaG [Bacterioplanoides sp.]|uniref:flagellar protein FlaG n=1 Tax=Bacterioplanoides sp. TaxID=2066072 RepID=UPI003B005248
MNDLKANINDRVQLLSAAGQKPVAAVSSGARAYQAEQGSALSGKGLPQQGAQVATVNNETVSREKVQEAISKLNDYVQSTERTLDFQLDEDSGRTVIKVFDKESSELIRQIPDELALTLAQKLNDEEPSLLFSAQV